MISLLTPFLCEGGFMFLLGGDGGIREGFKPFSSFSIKGLYKKSQDHIQLFYIQVLSKSTEALNVSLSIIIIFPIQPRQQLQAVLGHNT